MKIQNVHERVIPSENAALIDTLSSKDDRVWPADWPPMEFDRPLGVGAIGGHGPVRYRVVEYEPAKSVVFRFDEGEIGKGYDGTHRFDVIRENGEVKLRHEIDMEATIRGAIEWYSFVEPLHDALVEDALDRAEGVKRNEWSWWVRILRWIAIRRFS